MICQSILGKVFFVVLKKKKKKQKERREEENIKDFPHYPHQ